MILRRWNAIWTNQDQGFSQFVRFCSGLVGLNKQNDRGNDVKPRELWPEKTEHEGSLDDVVGYRYHGGVAYPPVTKGHLSKIAWENGQVWKQA